MLQSLPTGKNNLSKLTFAKSLLAILSLLVIAVGFNMDTVFSYAVSTPIGSNIQFNEMQRGYQDSSYAQFFDMQQASTWQFLKQFDYQQASQEPEPIVNSVLPEEELVEEVVVESKPKPQDQTVVEQKPPEPAKLKKGDKILLVGDSMILEATGIVFQRQLTAQGFKVKREGVYSTGFTNTAYYNWTSRIDELLDSYKPDAVIVYMGANDGQKIYSERDGYRLNYGTKNWAREYNQNVRDFLEVTSPEVTKVYLMGHAIASTADFTGKFRTINQSFSGVSGEFENVEFVDIWDRFAPNGYYQRVVPFNGKRLFAKHEDGIHLTNHGSEIAFDELKKSMADDIE
jgi:hypothetical protein